jgi:hypothetical protein
MSIALRLRNGFCFGLDIARTNSVEMVDSELLDLDGIEISVGPFAIFFGHAYLVEEG